jgi:transcriptional regulator with XRE-family HTH domain
MTTTHGATVISPLGSTAEEAANHRYQRSATYREQHDRLAPYRAIADAVILARSARKMTQRELGKVIGTTDTAISRIESGRRPVTLETLTKLGKALGLTFMVGSAEAAAKIKVQEGCVLVPDSAIEAVRGRAATERGAYVPPTSPRTAMPSYAFGDSGGAGSQAARKSR